MISSITKLPRRQQQAIPALLHTPTIRDAAKLAGVHEITLFKWMNQPGFQVAYRDARYLAMEEAFATLQKHCIEAAKTIIDVMHDKHANPYVRLHAAQAVLDMAIKSRVVDELEARITALEQWQHEEP